MITRVEYESFQEQCSQGTRVSTSYTLPPALNRFNFLCTFFELTTKSTPVWDEPHVRLGVRGDATGCVVHVRDAHAIEVEIDAPNEEGETIVCFSHHHIGSSARPTPFPTSLLATHKHRFCPVDEQLFHAMLEASDDNSKD
ncbi:hypothetical protein BLNAU_16981 [Blattamonas nauphoetae]|uniref:Uncharacterized protein n=1 Tax=Blattamonas nauphoetae TaxID=2049346 RepID=A0ABQ9XA16_9EUKA|nr:hypothetical protein BLNAU_16981 [Blattamonas nauphoetae]